MATHYKFMTAQYLLCCLFPAVSNGQISLISPGAVMFPEFVLVSLPSACVTAADHAIVVSSKKYLCINHHKISGFVVKDLCTSGVC